MGRYINIQTSPHISDLNSKINSPGQATNKQFKIIKTNNYNNQLFNCQLPKETEVTSTPTRPVEIVVITTKGLQDRNNLLLDGRTVCQ